MKSKDIDLKLTLDSLNIDELRKLAESYLIKSSSQLPKSLLIREIAWHLHSNSKNPLTRRCQRLLKEIVKHAQINKHSSKTEQSISKSSYRLKSGMVIERHWNEENHYVTVLDDGTQFLYKDIEYRSLSRIAKDITGSHWSGPRFFGLTQLNKK